MHLKYSHFHQPKNHLYSKPIKGLQGCGVSCRFAFNGFEIDNEVSGPGNSYTAEYWQYGPRLGRRWNVDPATNEKPWIGPYHTYSNNPINNIDPLGDSESPIFDDKSGIYLGSDDQGFYKGEMLYMSAEKFKELQSKSANGVVAHSDAVKNSITNSQLPNTTEGLKVFYNAINTIYKAAYPVVYGGNLNELYKDKVSVSGIVDGQNTNTVYGPKVTLEHHIELNLTADDYAQYDGGIVPEQRIVVNFNKRDQLNTTGNLLSNFYHEYELHGRQNMVVAKHPQIYLMQYLHPGFNLTTGKYREHILNRTNKKK